MRIKSLIILIQIILNRKIIVNRTSITQVDQYIYNDLLLDKDYYISFIKLHVCIMYMWMSSLNDSIEDF